MTLLFAALTLSHGLSATLALMACGLMGMATTAFPLIPSTSPDEDTWVGEAANLPFQFQVASGSTDALTGGGGTLGRGSVPICGTVFVTAAGVDAMTLATPVAGPPSGGSNQNDGLSLTIIDTTGHAHTITTATNKVNGNKKTITFGGTVGNFVELIAFQGVWYVAAFAGVTLS